MSGKNFAGNLRIAQVNKDGVVIGPFIGILNTVKCELQTPAPENIDQNSKNISTIGQLKSRAQIPKPTTLAVSIDDLDDQRVMAFALNGISQAFAQAAKHVKTQAGGAVVDEAVSATTLGTPIQLANFAVSSVVVKNSAGSTTYVVNTDYTVDAINGTVTPLTGGTITASQALKVSYTAAALAPLSVNAPATFGDWIPLSGRHVKNVVVKNSGGSTTYVAGTDYVLDAKPGFLRIVEGGAITAGQALKISYDLPALTGSRVRGSLVPSTLLRVEVQLESTVDGSEGYFVCPIFQASSSGNQDLFGKNMLVAGLQGAMFLPPEGTAANTETGGAPYLLDDGIEEAA
jgi:hypothetical protein